MLLILAAASSAGAEQQPLTSIHNFHRVSDDLLTAGQVTPAHVQALADAGVEMVINLAPASAARNADEGFLITQQGMSYVQIPVAWDNPTTADFQLFSAVMNARQNRKTLVHCFANYRASAFTYLHRVINEGVPEAQARKALELVWDEEAFDEAKVWRAFIDRQLAIYEATGLE
jgi:protein tyrosine phosphatase (PTP) superfamily phosphohydrolase (DUF442 family)